MSEATNESAAGTVEDGRDASRESDACVASETSTPQSRALAERLRVERALLANHANTLPMLEILRACDTGEPRPYRELEDEVYDLPVMRLSHQNAHTLSLLLVECGALEQTFVEEGSAGSEPGIVDADDATDSDEPAADEPAPSQLEDQPVDYLLSITAAGAAALDTFEPAKRYQRMMATEPASYREVYRTVLSLCEQGKRMDDIESRLATMPAMRTPKVVYAGHFVSNLETVDGIAWDDDARLWKTTPHGQVMATL